MLKISGIAGTLGIIDPSILWNNELSLTAKGIHATILNVRGCKIDVKELYNCSADTKEDVDNAIKELLEKGLIEFEQ